MNNKILIAGGAGFLGTNLAHYLKDKAQSITIVDNLCTGSLSNLKTLEKYQNIKFIKHDIINQFDFKDEKYDVIFNLASPASPIPYQKNPIFTLKTNVIGTLNLLEIAKKHKAIFFQASTSEVYGDPEKHPQTEDYWGNVNPIGIRSCYDEGKRAAEALSMDYKRYHGVQVKIIRIFNTYGPFMDPEDGRVVSNFITQALQGLPLTMYGQGEQTRSLCYVDDLLKGIMAMVNSDVTGPVNIGNPEEITVKDLANLIINLCQSKSQIVYCPLPLDDPKKRCPDISLAKTLGWQPQILLKDGLLKAIYYFKTRMLNEPYVSS
ncbi:UDP-glucuronic acid decarboxylase family protein [Candidatus Trichorickettsia mobilis]|uniref:UDP-glucuronic acid decarboxylase family protein n=1 Tax=Candidatus Trichorickettsia mobilis TaxID=1346319 RepID=UPI00292EA6DB|nr:UDP-glucuronic acid decarboxylase family protein [Candidatus Trichorickettsia mobilis]